MAIDIPGQTAVAVDDAPPRRHRAGDLRRLPLYVNAGHTQPGSLVGDSAHEFGGRWYAVLSMDQSTPLYRNSRGTFVAGGRTGHHNFDKTQAPRRRSPSGSRLPLRAASLREQQRR
jgi:hypothetical protein